MNITEELNRYNVSRETIAKLHRFVGLLTEWNNKMNLVSKASLENVWERHVLDSAQLVSYLPENVKSIIDIGSGAGFPGVVLAILLQEQKNECQITLVESITKKAKFLQSICLELNLDNVHVINDRIENLSFVDVDIITARAVASLDVLIGYMNKICKDETKMILLKGKSYKQEAEEAQKRWQYEGRVFANKYSEGGVIMEIKHTRKKK